MMRFSLVAAFSLVLAFSCCFLSIAAPIPLSGGNLLAARGKESTPKTPAPKFNPVASSTGSKTMADISDLKEGDVIYAEVVINTADVADPNSKSTTAKKIKKGDPVKRICVVLAPGAKSVQVTYFATFARSTTLPATITDKSMWYPFDPATKEGTHAPLPAYNAGVAQWASLRKKQTVSAAQVEKIGNIAKTSADSILHAMKA